MFSRKGAKKQRTQRMVATDGTNEHECYFTQRLMVLLVGFGIAAMAINFFEAKVYCGCCVRHATRQRWH